MAASKTRPIKRSVAAFIAAALALSIVAAYAVVPAALALRTPGSAAAIPAGGMATPPFQPVVVPADGGFPTGLALLDVDHDGREDVIVAVRPGEVMVLRGGGAGGPEPAARYPVGMGPTGVAAADLNGDGLRDLVVLNWSSADLSILLAGPDGAFLPERRQTFLPGATRNDLEPGAFQALALADFDGDGRIDAAVAHRSGISLLRGQGDGTFTLLGQAPAGDRPFSVVAADADADGRIDLATTNIASDDVVILRGAGDGTFDTVPGVPAGVTPRGLAAGDINGDGAIDLVTANEYSGDPLEYVGDVSVLIGRGDGGFDPAVRYRAGRVTTYVVLADFDEDGNADIAAGNTASGDISVFHGEGDGTFGEQRTVRVGVSPAGLLALDHDADGHLDLASSIGAVGIAFVRGNGAGGFDAPAAHPLIMDPTCVATADMDGDGLLDVVVGGSERVFNTADVSILPGLGDGTFGPSTDLDMTDFSHAISDLVVADFDLDGRADLAVADGVRSVGILLARGGAGDMSTAWIQTGAGAHALAVADFDGNGAPDLAVAHYSTEGVVVLLGHGDGEFDFGSRLPIGYRYTHVVTADFDGDGHADVAVAGTDLTTAAGYRDIVHVYRGRGDGRFDDPLRLDLAASPTGMAQANLTGDGRPDLVVTSSFEFTLFANEGNLGFAPGAPRPGPWFMSDVLAADVTRDGIPDAVVLSPQWEAISVFPSTDVGTSEAEMRTVGGRVVTAFAVGDLDGDGAADLVTADRGLRDAFIGSRPTLSVLLNRAHAPNRAPVAAATAPATVECDSWEGASVRLDGTASHDPDAAPGVGEDALAFAWFADYGSPSQVAIGAGAILDVTLAPGPHAITLLVTDRAGASDTATVAVVVEDTTPPTLELTLDGPAVVWPPDHRLAGVTVRASGRDRCGPVAITLVSVTSSEPDDAPGGGDGHTTGDIRDADTGRADFYLLLRAERSATGSGRTYTIVYRALDSGGLGVDGTVSVAVPRYPPPEPGTARGSRAGIQNLPRDAGIRCRRPFRSVAAPSIAPLRRGAQRNHQVIPVALR